MARFAAVSRPATATWPRRVCRRSSLSPQASRGVFGAVRACQKLPPELLGQRDLAVASGYPSHQKPDLGVVAFRWLRKSIRHAFGIGFGSWNTYMLLWVRVPRRAALLSL